MYKLNLWSTNDEWHKLLGIVITTCIWWIFTLMHSLSLSLSISLFTRNYELMICNLTYMKWNDFSCETWYYTMTSRELFSISMAIQTCGMSYYGESSSSHGICHLICISFSFQYYYHVQFEALSHYYHRIIQNCSVPIHIQLKFNQWDVNKLILEKWNIHEKLSGLLSLFNWKYCKIIHMPILQKF